MEQVQRQLTLNLLARSEAPTQSVPLTAQGANAQLSPAVFPAATTTVTCQPSGAATASDLPSLHAPHHAKHGPVIAAYLLSSEAGACDVMIPWLPA
jgi:hypothetical protein